jgi:hypothetical protein
MKYNKKMLHEEKRADNHKQWQSNKRISDLRKSLSNSVSNLIEYFFVCLANLYSGGIPVDDSNLFVWNLLGI